MTHQQILGLSVFLLLLATSCSDKLRYCKKIDNCKCKFTDDGNVIDLSPLTKLGTPAFKDVHGNDGLNYSYSPCVSFNEGACRESTICQTDGNKTTKIANETAAFYMKGDGIGLQYEFNNYVSKIDLICDSQHKKPVFQANGLIPGGNTFQFTLTSVSGCPIDVNESSGGLSAGGIILIVFFTLLFLYLVIGVLDAKFRKKAVGFELIPHFEFWSKLPGLISDGLGFVITCSCCAKKSRLSYVEVDK